VSGLHPAPPSDARTAARAIHGRDRGNFILLMPLKMAIAARVAIQVCVIAPQWAARARIHGCFRHRLG
jgi:hypothetical protein